MTEKRAALLIATSRYEDARLQRLAAPLQDAEALAQVLSDPAIGNFEVQTILNESSYTVKRKIDAFFADRRRHDLLLLYFSCHGIKDQRGQLIYLIS